MQLPSPRLPPYDLAEWRRQPWNFGDGHLHDERLVAAVQARCGFESGQLRCVLVESQPMLKPRMRWRVVDAHDGRIATGEVAIDDLVHLQPWPQP